MHLGPAAHLLGNRVLGASLGGAGRPRPWPGCRGREGRASGGGVHTHTCTHRDMHTQAHKHVHTQACADTDTCTHRHTQRHTDTHRDTHRHVHTQSHTGMRTDTHLHTHTHAHPLAQTTGSRGHRCSDAAQSRDPKDSGGSEAEAGAVGAAGRRPTGGCRGGPGAPPPRGQALLMGTTLVSANARRDLRSHDAGRPPSEVVQASRPRESKPHLGRSDDFKVKS